MSSTGIAVSILRFGAFELDLRTNELRRAGVLIKLSPQQIRVLRLLLENAGRVCTREEFQREIWGSEVFVDFERGLNVSIAQIRAALNDDAEAPRFIQTVPRRGYRFLAPVEQVGLPPRPAEVTETPAVAPSHQRRYTVLALVLGIAALCGGATVYLRNGQTSDRRITLAVLPFGNLTRAPGDAPVLEGLVDELITQFGTLSPERLSVIGRTSVLRYADTHAALPQIGRELGAQYVLEGGLRREAGRVRITARLVNVSDQSQAWNETYEEDGANLLELEEGVAAHITAAVARRLFAQDPAASRPAHVPDRAAYEAWIAGRYLERKNNRADAQRAIARYQEAAARDPAFAEPWAAIAQISVGLAMSGGMPPAQAFSTARSAAEHALRLEDGNGAAHNALASVFFWNDWNWKEAGRQFQRAIAINPSDARAQHDYAAYLVALGQPEQGLAALRRAIALDPLSPRVNIDAGWVLLQAHHFDEAIRQARRALELEPGLPEAAACIARAEQFRGHATPAMLDFYRLRIRDAARNDPYTLAVAYAVFNRNDEAIRQLQSAYAQHSMLMPLANTEPAFLHLHNNQWFRAIITRLGLSPGDS